MHKPNSNFLWVTAAFYVVRVLWADLMSLTAVQKEQPPLPLHVFGKLFCFAAEVGLHWLMLLCTGAALHGQGVLCLIASAWSHNGMDKNECLFMNLLLASFVSHSGSILDV